MKSTKCRKFIMLMSAVVVGAVIVFLCDERNDVLSLENEEDRESVVVQEEVSEISEVDVGELVQLIKSVGNDLEIIDMRVKSEFDKSHLLGSRWIFYDEIRGRYDEIDWEKMVVFVCRGGRKSGIIMNDVEKVMGKKSINFVGGMMSCFDNEECLKLLE